MQAYRRQPRRGFAGYPLRQIGDDHLHNGVVDILRQLQLDILRQHRRGFACCWHVSDQSRGNAAIGAHLHGSAELVISPHKNAESYPAGR